MSGWFDAKSFTSLAKSALTQAQKQFDKALEAVVDEDSDGDETVTGLDPFEAAGWASRKSKEAKEKKNTEELVVKQISAAGEGDGSKAGNIEQETEPQVESTVTSQVKPSNDVPVGPITVQVRSQQKEEGDEADSSAVSSPAVDELSISSANMGVSSDSVETTVQASDLDFSMLDETKGQFFEQGNSKSSSPLCNSEHSGSGARSAESETTASSDIEIISAINSTPSEAMNQEESCMWESDALSSALRELSGETGGTAVENLLHSREQKVMVLCGENARLVDEAERLRVKIAQLEARNLESCRTSSEQVQQLIVEGERMAKEVLEKTNILKKLRVKEKEQEELIKKQTKEIEETSGQLERLRKSLAHKDAQERAHVDQIRELKAAKITAADLKKQLDQTKARCAELESRNSKILMESKVMTASVELSAQDQFRSGMAEVKARHSEEVESLRQKTVQLEASLKRAEAMFTQNEQHGKSLRDEVLSLQEKNQELTESLALVTAPYVRELEKMKSVHDCERRGFESEMVNLQRMVETLRHKYSESEEKLQAALTANRLQENDKRDLLARIEDLQEKLEESKRNQMPTKSDTGNHLNYIDILKSQLIEREDAITKMNQTIELLRSKETSLQQKILNLEQSVDFERQKSRLEKTDNRPESPAVSNRSSLESSDIERNDNFSIFSSNMNSPSVIDNMSTQLKLKDGQMQQLRVELIQLKKSRDTLSEQLTETSTELERFKNQEAVLTDVSEKYEALLQMYGELVEKNDELKLDLEEARNAYRVQIQDLTTRLKRSNI